METSTLKSRILQAFQQMNTSLLKQILSENQAGNFEALPVYLQQFEKLFSKFKASGDTELIAYTGQCMTEDKEVCVNCGKKGFSFFGNHSNNFIDLIFEEENGILTDIIFCSDFSNFQKLDLNKLLNPKIFADESFFHQSNPELQPLFEQCKKACAELTAYPGIIEPEIYNPWLVKHQSLVDYIKKNIEENYRAVNTFLEYYFGLQDIARFGKNNSHFVRAVVEFHCEVFPNDEDTINLWLRKFDALRFDAVMMLLLPYPELENYENHKFLQLHDLKISMEDLIPCLDLVTCFKKMDEWKKISLKRSN